MRKERNRWLIPCLAVCCLGAFPFTAFAEQTTEQVTEQAAEQTTELASEQAAESAAGSAAGQTEAVAHQAADGITIDGNLDEWDLSSPIVINSQEQVTRDAETWLGETDLSANVYVMWDEENLYLGAEVKEASAFGAVGLLSHDMEDNMKIYISTDPDADPARTTYGTNDFLLYLMMDNQNWYTAFDRSMVDREVMERFTSQGMEDNGQVLEGYEAAYTSGEGSYTLELVIPWVNFSNDYIEVYVPAVGDTVNFDVSLTDNDYPYPNTQSSVQMNWCGTDEIDKNPSLWGRLRFE